VRVEAALSAMVEVEERTGEMDNERYQQLWEERWDAYDRVADTRARTLNGILAKLALVAPDFNDESASELPAEMGISPDVLFSIAVDFKELKAGGAMKANFTGDAA
jgi:hypothetical protein